MSRTGVPARVPTGVPAGVSTGVPAGVQQEFMHKFQHEFKQEFEQAFKQEFRQKSLQEVLRTELLVYVTGIILIFLLIRGKQREAWYVIWSKHRCHRSAKTKWHVSVENKSWSFPNIQVSVSHMHLCVLWMSQYVCTIPTYFLPDIDSQTRPNILRLYFGSLLQTLVCNLLRSLCQCMPASQR